MITQERLKELLEYDPETGLFKWREGLSKPFKTSGKNAGYKRNHGYLVIRVDNQEYLAHRLAWLYVYGAFPENDLDHINRDRADNRITNLRACTHPENMMNRTISSHNTSGQVGVSFCKRYQQYKARISAFGRRMSLGYHDTLEEASEAYKLGKLMYHSFPE